MEINNKTVLDISTLKMIEYNPGGYIEL